jgi:transketolase
MRRTLAENMLKICETQNAYFLTGDIGSFGLKPFADKHPDKFINCGVAEANMVGVAAGLAMSGAVVYIHSIVPFITMRCYEQLRVDAAMQNLPIKVLSVGACFDYSTMGVTHHGYEDLALMKSFPNFRVSVPSSPVEFKEVMLASASRSCPEYIRLTTANIKGYNGSPILREGTGTVVLSYGALLQDILDVCEQEKLSARVVNMSCLKPLPDLKPLLSGCERVVVAEEHFANGGLGQEVGYQIAKEGYGVDFDALFVKDYVRSYGTYDDMKKAAGLDKATIAQAIRGTQ